jgi:hypothetical protein
MQFEAAQQLQSVSTHSVKRRGALRYFQAVDKYGALVIVGKPLQAIAFL